MMAEKLFLYQLTLCEAYKNPENWTDQINNIIAEHAKFMHQLGQTGTLVLAGRTQYNIDDERLFDIAIIKAKNMEDVQDIMKNDPGVVHGIQQASYFEFNMSMNYTQNL